MTTASSGTVETVTGGLCFLTDSAVVLYLRLQCQLICCYTHECPHRKIQIKLVVEFFPMVMLWILLSLLGSVLNTALTSPAGTCLSYLFLI